MLRRLSRVPTDKGFVEMYGPRLYVRPLTGFLQG